MKHNLILALLAFAFLEAIVVDASSSTTVSESFKLYGLKD